MALITSNVLLGCATLDRLFPLLRLLTSIIGGSLARCALFKRQWYHPTFTQQRILLELSLIQG